jgi:hypothetical protein
VEHKTSTVLFFDESSVMKFLQVLAGIPEISSQDGGKHIERQSALLFNEK